MSVIDSFYLLFKGDSSNVKKVLEETRKEGKDTADELRAVDKAAYEMGQSIGRGIRELGGLVAGYLAARALTQSFTEAVMAADKLDETAQRLNISIETLSAWGDAAKEAGGSTEGLISSVESFNNALSMMEVTGKSRAAPFLMELGINLDDAANKGKTAFELFPKIAAAMEGMDVQKSGAIGRKLGLDAGTIMLLQMGGKGVDELVAKMRALGVVTKEQGEVAAKFNDQLDDARHSLRSVWLEIATAVLPALTWLAKKFEELFTFMRTHSDFIVGLMIAIGSTIALLVVPSLLSMAASALLALAPFILIGAAIAAIATAFALVYDDIVNFMEGNDSLIGQFIEQYPQAGEVLKNLGDLFGWLGDTAKSLGQIVSALFNLLIQGAVALGAHVLKTFGALLSYIPLVGYVFRAVGELVSEIFNYWIDAIDRFISKFGGVVGIAKSIGGAITSALDWTKGKLDIGTTGQQMGPPVPGLAEGQLQLGEISKSPVGSLTTNTIRNSSSAVSKSTNVQIDKVEVQTQATDTAGISKSIGDTLGAQLRQASSNFDDGVLA